ncbi:TIGR02281 family clan AA aspartic protease [Undibacterium sp. TS12]|uniref:retropepsin-like aspartic protease family protein n=1 Tax=Undibacterium sp. TS12 TaxID=2908202 RepID=UPI001F4CC12D|nr:TIGR02281 family clan AA aspartic protease [Undibacterium sp. TS12]MCH8622847.1 TIGR02281 family clan AA aspartic protease [Undibacterium sp. TS12]
MKTISTLAALLLLTGTTLAQATDIGVVGLFPGKAILVVDGAAPKTYSVGSNINSEAKLIEADRETATVMINGKRKVLVMGQTVHRSGPAVSDSVVLKVGDRGHFMAQAMINGVGINMLVDTGASLIALPASEAIRLGLNYRQGQRGSASTAGGVVPTYLIRLDSVKIGGVELNGVEASVIEQGLNVPLLGMSFLNRMEMRREGDQMTLTKRY